MLHCHLYTLSNLNNNFLLFKKYFAKDDRGIQKQFLAYLFFKKSTLYINMIETISKQSQMSLQNNKYHGVKQTYKMSPLTTLHLLCVFCTLLSQHLIAVSYSATLAAS